MPHGAEAAASAIGDAPDGRTFAKLAIFSDIGKKMWGEPLGQSHIGIFICLCFAFFRGAINPHKMIHQRNYGIALKSAGNPLDSGHRAVGVELHLDERFLQKTQALKMQNL